MTKEEKILNKHLCMQDELPDSCFNQIHDAMKECANDKVKKHEEVGQEMLELIMKLHKKAGRDQDMWFDEISPVLHRFNNMLS